MALRMKLPGEFMNIKPRQTRPINELLAEQHTAYECHTEGNALLILYMASISRRVRLL